MAAGPLATLDPRLLQLFETLAASNADWLVFEIIDGVQAGIVREESEEDLARARFSARQGGEAREPGTFPATLPETRPIEGDEQVWWAAGYVGIRLKETVGMMTASMERLGRIAESEPSELRKRPFPGVSLGIVDADAVVTVSQSDAGAAQEATSALLDALDRWAAEATERGRAR